MRSVKFFTAILGIIFSVAASAAAQIEVPNVLVKLIDQAEVPAREAGVLLEVGVKEGSRITEGTLLARIDDTEAQLTVQRAKVELEIARKSAVSDTAIRSAEKTLNVAQLEWQRAQESVARFPDAITRTELDRLNLAVDQALLAVEKTRQEQAIAVLTQEMKQVELDFAARNVVRRQIVAPFGGVVAQMLSRRGEWVEPGQKVLRLVRLDRLRVEGFASAKQATSRLEGKSVRLTVDLPGSPAAKFAGKLVFVSPEIDPVNGQVRILAELDNPDLRLQPGLKGSLVIESSPAP